MRMIAYGGGTNSVAMICGMIENGEPPVDIILFADTGGEKPHTYQHINEMNIVLQILGWPTITVVRKTDRLGENLNLEEYCLRKGQLPSLAYGFKTCSQKYKIAPQDKYMNNNESAKQCWANGEKIIKYVGFDADEPHRAQRVPPECDKYVRKFPLIEYGWGRDECVQAIKRFGINLPGKSSCFFCPASKKTEVRWLRDNEPMLYMRAVIMEMTAAPNFTSIKGLGRNYAWASMLNESAVCSVRDSIEQDCGCYDGE